MDACAWVGRSGRERNRRGLCAASRAILDAAPEKEVEWAARESAIRFAPSESKSRHVPVLMHSCCRMRNTKRRILLQRAWATRFAIEKQKVGGLFLLRAAKGVRAVYVKTSLRLAWQDRQSFGC